MNEKPILFSAPMIRAILEGRKTQTRRVVKLDAWVRAAGCKSLDGAWADPGMGAGAYLKVAGLQDTYWRLRCPYGAIEGKLWVKESYRFGRGYDGLRPKKVRASKSVKIHYEADGPAPRWAGKLRPSIFMRRWASRITLEIVNVRVHRLQEITEEDAKSEGISEVTKDGNVKKFCVYDRGDMSSTPWADMPKTAKEAFRSLWDKFNGPRGHGWATNPFCWVIEFKRVQ